MESRLIDLSHTIRDGEVTYRGFPAPVICDFLSREESRQHYDGDTEFQIGKIELISNTGTYIDCPFHRYADGDDLSQVELQKMASLDGVLIKAPYTAGLAVGVDFFINVDVRGKAVLVNTGWSEHWQTDTYFSGHPYLTEEAAQYLRDQGVVLVGIDSYNIDDTSQRTRPVHTTLLREGILIVEHMTNLMALEGLEFTFTAVPPKVEGMGTFPVRAFAKIIN